MTPEHTSYLPLVDRFSAHWELVDARVGPPGVETPSGVTRAGFLAMRGELAAALLAVTRAENTVEYSRGRQELLRNQAYERLGELTGCLRAWWKGTAIGESAPRLPSMTSALDKFLQPARDGLRLWEKVNASAVAPSGIVLPLRLGLALDFSRADFAALVDALVAEGLAQEAAELEARLARWERDAVERRLRAAMVEYRQVARARLRPVDAEWESLPKLG